MKASAIIWSIVCGTGLFALGLTVAPNVGRNVEPFIGSSLTPDQSPNDSSPPVWIHTIPFEAHYPDSLELSRSHGYFILDGEALSQDSWIPKVAEAIRKKKAQYLVISITDQDRFGAFARIVFQVKKLPVKGVIILVSEEPNQALEPTIPGGTPRAETKPRVAPPGIVAHLER